jgi:hypothetical protein
MERDTHDLMPDVRDLGVVLCVYHMLDLEAVPYGFHDVSERSCVELGFIYLDI